MLLSCADLESFLSLQTFLLVDCYSRKCYSCSSRKENSISLSFHQRLYFDLLFVLVPALQSLPQPAVELVFSWLFFIPYLLQIVKGCEFKSDPQKTATELFFAIKSIKNVFRFNNKKTQKANLLKFWTLLSRRYLGLMWNWLSQ